jgi:hypothetical protein
MPNETNNQRVDGVLNAVAIKQLTWKPSQLRNIAVAITRAALNKSLIWPDEIDFSHVAMPDKNCIGSAWRMLTKAGVIEAIPEFRRSRAADANGRKVFHYALASRRRALTFLERNGEPYDPQPTLL